MASALATRPIRDQLISVAGERTILITGFEPFGGDRRNPSAEIARMLNGHEIAGCRVVGAVLPCEFGAGWRALRALRRRHRPSVVLCTGLANERRAITPERVALNVDDARIPDNAGRQPIDRPIVRGAPTGYWSTLPIKAIVRALKRRELPAAISTTAGTFVCNHVFYALMHELRRTRAVPAGFIHVPWPKEWGGTAASAISLPEMVTAIEMAAQQTLQSIPRRRQDHRPRKRRSGAKTIRSAG